MHDVIIVGGGPAGITAAATAINQRIDAFIIAARWGGQTTYSMELEDMEGRQAPTGEALLDSFRRQLDYLDFVRDFDTVIKITPGEQGFVSETAHGDRYESKALIMATGAKPQRLQVPGEAELTGRGLSYSATTHSSLFLGKDVAVVGGGPRAQRAAAALAHKTHHAYLFAPEILPDTPLVARLRAQENVEVMEGVRVVEILGESFVEGIAISTPTEERQQIPVKGVFVKLRRTPNSNLVRDWVDCDEDGHIIVDVNCATSCAGIFAAGDVSHVSEQVLVHIGEGAKAALSAYHYLLAL
jgi:thioredoxin reductase